MRLTALFALSLAALPSLADEVDLTPRGSRRSGEAPTWVVRLEGGDEFAPFGRIGGALSYFNSGFELEGGLGGGFPGAQYGLAARSLFGNPFAYFLTELSLAVNAKTSPFADTSSAPSTAGRGSTVWTNLGLGFEHREDLLELNAVAGLAFDPSNFGAPHFVIHGGVGFGF